MPSATGDSAASSSARHLEDTSDNADLGFAEEGPKETVKKCKKTLNKITAPFPVDSRNVGLTNGKNRERNGKKTSGNPVT